jgi:hypothetical protein
MPLHLAKQAFHRVIAAVSDCLVDLENVLSMERRASHAHHALTP